MILAIDIGNTNIVVGCIDDQKTYFIERLATVRTKTELEYAVDLKTLLEIYHIKKGRHRRLYHFICSPADHQHCQAGSRKDPQKRSHGPGTRSKNRSEHHDG